MSGHEKIPVEESMEGAVVYNVPFPSDLKGLDQMAPIILKHPYRIDYIHSYGQDSPFFAGLANKRLMGTKCTACGHAFATPRKACMECGAECEWVELPQEARIHAFTVCHFGSEEFLPDCPFVLAQVEFDGVDTLFLTRVLGLDPNAPSLDWIGKKVKARFRRLSRLKPTDVWFEPL